MDIFKMPETVLVQHTHASPEQNAEISPLDTSDIEQLQSSDPESWLLLSFVYGDGPIYSHDVTLSKHYSSEFFLINDGVTPEAFHQIILEAQGLLSEHESDSTEDIKPLNSSLLTSLIHSNSLVADENVQNAIKYLFKSARKMLNERRKWQQALDDIKRNQSVFLQRQSPEARFPENLLPPSLFEQHYYNNHFNWDNVWAALIILGLFAFIGWMGFITGAYRIPEIANATGFHITLPANHDWAELGSSKWTSPSDDIFGEPYKIVVLPLEVEESNGIRNLMIQNGTKISLPVGTAYRLVVPRRGSLFLQTGKVGITYYIETAAGIWSIMTISLTESEADALAQSFTIP